MPALAEYQRHAELYGPDCVVQTAARELPEGELTQLMGFVDHLERTGKFVKGSWRARNEKPPRKCQGCGLDLPANARANRDFHDGACRARKRRLRDTASDQAEGAGSGANEYASPSQGRVHGSESPDDAVPTPAA